MPNDENVDEKAEIGLSSKTNNLERRRELNGKILERNLTWKPATQIPRLFTAITNVIFDGPLFHERPRK